MPGPPQDIQDFTQVLKTVYLPVRRKAFPLLTPLLAAARKLGPKQVRYAGGHDLVFDVKLGRRGGFVSSTQGFLPHAKQSRERQGRLSIARTYAVSSVDGLLWRSTQRDEASYISAAAKIVEDMQEQWQLEQNRVLHGDSLGVRAVLVGVASTSQVTADDPYGIADAGPGNLHLEVGDDIAVLSSDGATLRGKTQISSISLSGDVATFVYTDAVAGQQIGDVIVTAVPSSVDSNDTSWGAEPYGLKAIMDVEGNFDTFEGISDDRWVATKLVSSTVDEIVLMRLLNLIRARAGVDWRSDPKNMILLTTTGIWQTYGESLLGFRRVSAPVMELKGGFKGVGVGNAVLVDDPWAPRGRLQAVHGPDTCFIDLMDFGELSIEDAPKWQRASNRDAYEAAHGAYWNYGATLRASHGVISGITDTVNYSPIF